MKTVLAVLKTFFFIAIMAGLMTGCVSSRSGKVYSRDDARKMHVVEIGIVESVKKILIEGTKTSVGSTVGAVTGGIVGSTVGGGSGKTLATVAGALAGAAAGTMAEEELTKKDGLEIIVRKDSGETIVIVQEADIPIAAGDRVRIITSDNGTVRVSK